MKFNIETYIILLVMVIFHSCSPVTEKNSPFAYELGVVAGFSELVNAGVKQLALSSPMPVNEMDEFIELAQKVAAKHNVLVYRESDLIVTDLFPSDIAKNLDVLLLYQGNTKSAYESIKRDKAQLTKSEQYDGASRIDIARRFGRLLSYSPKKINQLLAENTSFRTMGDFGIRASNVFLYYKNLKVASQFYSDILGLERLASYDNADIFRITGDSYLILVDAAKGMHSAEEPKTVALALLTDQLDEWYDYLKSQDVLMKYDYKPKTGNAHDGFVMIDPEGYLLEFERFKQHKENELFIPLLERNETVVQRSGQESKVPDHLGFHSSITWLYYKNLLSMQNFYEDVMGLELVADQGWTKIYKSSESGFIGLVDERRGMHQYTEEKAVTVSFILDDLEGWFQYVQDHEPIQLRSDQIELGPEGKYSAFVGYDPEGYFLEFDGFHAHQDNSKLMEYLTTY